MVLHKGYIPFNGIEEDREFLETLTELGQLDFLIPFDVLIDQNKIFSPFELNEDILTQILMYSFTKTMQ